MAWVKATSPYQTISVLVEAISHEGGSDIRDARRSFIRLPKPRAVSRSRRVPRRASALRAARSGIPFQETCREVAVADEFGGRVTEQLLVLP